MTGFFSRDRELRSAYAAITVAGLCAAFTYAAAFVSADSNGYAEGWNALRMLAPIIFLIAIAIYAELRFVFRIK